jgi:hypothetical protein
MSVPDWLLIRDGGLSPGLRPDCLFVLINGQPQYRLDVRPAAGSYVCAITQTVNGRRIDPANGANFANPEEALRGGLDQLRNALGW